MNFVELISLLLNHFNLVDFLRKLVSYKRFCSTKDANTGFYQMAVILLSGSITNYIPMFNFNSFEKMSLVCKFVKLYELVEQASLLCSLFMK